MKILAIETSCDETAVAILEGEGALEKTRLKVLGNALLSQASLHAPYGGVFPALAKREHQGNLVPLAVAALTEAGMLLETGSTGSLDCGDFEIRDEPFKDAVCAFLKKYEKPDIDCIAVTHGPGLEMALWTGINFAEALSKAWDIPLLGIDHLEGHIISAFLKKESESEYSISNLEFPILALLISGGHTEFVLMKEPFRYEQVGQTKDDAVGEAFDKVARLLELPYPGGPHIAAAAARAREAPQTKEGGEKIEFPRPMAGDNTCDFSFSGLKTAVLYKMREMNKIDGSDKEKIAEAFEDAARDVIVIKTKRALEQTSAKVLAVGGGVSANLEIRNALSKLVADKFPSITLAFPEESLTGDNAIMIGAAGYLRHAAGIAPSGKLSATGNLRLAN